MRMSEAMRLINRAAGYRICYEKREGGMLDSGHFPERDEPPIADEDDAWKLAEEFAAVDAQTYVNIYVIWARDWTPVPGYEAKKLNAYPPPPECRDVRCEQTVAKDGR